MLFADGAPNIFDADEVVLGLKSSIDGLSLVCVGVKTITIWRTLRNTWIPVASCENANVQNVQAETFGCSIAWKVDGSSFVVVYHRSCGDGHDGHDGDDGHGQQADFYSLKDIEPEVRAVNLSLPKWVENRADPYSPLLCEVAHLSTVKTTVDGIPISLLSVVSNRMFLLMGTNTGTIVRVLWTGEIVCEKEIPAVRLFTHTESKVESEPVSDGVVRLSIGFDQNIGFVSNSGLCGIVALGADKEKYHPILIRRKNCKSVALHVRRRLVVVGLDESNKGDVLVYSVRNKQAIHLRTLTLSSLGLYSIKTWACKIDWCSDTEMTSFAVAYRNTGLVIWSAYGCKQLSVLPNDVLKLSNNGEDDTCSLPISFTWANHSFHFLAVTPNLVKSGSRLNGHQDQNQQQQRFWQTEMLKCLMPKFSNNGATRMCLTGSDHIRLLRSQDWDSHSLSWNRLPLPDDYLLSNWPIKHIAASKDGMQLAVSGKHGVCLYNQSLKKWRLFGNINQEIEINAFGLFWCGSDIVCIVNRTGYKYTLLFYPRDHLDYYSLLCSYELPSRPLAIDTNLANKTMVIHYVEALCVYSIELSHVLNSSKVAKKNSSRKDLNGGIDSPGQLLTGGKATIIVKLESRVVYVGSQIMASDGKGNSGENKMPENRELDHAVSICILPCGGTRRAGCSIKLPKCVVLTSDGILYVVDTEQGQCITITDDVEQIITQSWEDMQTTSSGHTNRYLSHSGIHKTKINLPSTVLFTIWICDSSGLRLWLPALDVNGDVLNTRCAHFDLEVYPMGVSQSHGVVVGLSQRENGIQGLQDWLWSCYQIGVRVQPSTHGVLRWLVQADRLPLAADVLLQASQHFALFRESIELLLYSAVESDYQKESEIPILPRVLNLLRKGKSTIVIKDQSFASIVVSCARKLEVSRWDQLFPLVGKPEQFFNDCIYHGELRTAAAFCLIADHYDPENSSQRLAALSGLAEKHDDTRLLKEIKHYTEARIPPDWDG